MDGIVGLVGEQKTQPPFVRFERVRVEDAAASKREHRFMGRDVDYALITPAYSKDIFKQKVAAWFEQLERDVIANRVPQTWFDQFKARYEAFKDGKELPLDGTPILGWPVLSPALQELLIHHKIMTVESAAGMTDEALRRVGMGANDIKNKAVAWLQAAQDKGPLTMEVSALKSENELLKTNLAAMGETVKAMKMQLDSMSVPQAPTQSVGITAADLVDDVDDEPRRGPGRPRKSLIENTA